MAKLTMMKPRLPMLDTRIVKPPAPITDRRIYRTNAHKKWAREVKRRAGWRCSICDRDRSQTQLYADHIVELKDGGEPLDPKNGRCICASCHGRKTAEERELRGG